MLAQEFMGHVQGVSTEPPPASFTIDPDQIVKDAKAAAARQNKWVITID